MPRSPTNTNSWTPNCFFNDADLFSDSGRIAGVAGKDSHGQRFTLLVGEQADDDLQLAALAVAIVPVLAQGVVLAFQVAAGDVVKEQGGRDGAALQIALVEGLLDGLLAGTKIVEGGVEVVLVEGAEVENFGDGVIFGPAHGGQTRAVVSDAGQDEEEREFGEAGLAEGVGEAEGVGDLLEDEEEAEYGAAGGKRVEVVEVAAEGALEGEDAGGVPMGEVGEGAFVNLAVEAEGLPEEDGGRGVPVGDGGDVHVPQYHHYQGNTVSISTFTWVQ